MKRVITGQDEIFGPWLAKRTDGQWVPGRGSTIGLWEDGVGPIASVLFDSYNGASVCMHVAAEGKRWMNREFLWFVFYYPFEQLRVTKIIGVVESTNHQARRFDEHIGFTLEATLKDAAPKGDLLIYTMTRDQCRWLNLKGKKNVQAQGSEGP